MNIANHYHPLMMNNQLNGVPNPPDVQGQGFGHKFEVVREKLKIFFIDLFHAIADAFNEHSRLGKIFKFSINVLNGIAYAVGSAFHGAGLLKVLNIADNFNDCLDLILDADHFINGKFKDKEGKVNKFSLVANLAFLVADVGGIVLWLNDLALINLAKISASIGKGFSKLASALGPGLTKFTQVVTRTHPFIAKTAVKFAAKVTLINVIRGLVGVAFLALAINEVRNIVSAVKERNIQKVVNSSLYLTSYIAEIALKVLALASCTCVPGLITVGCIAAGFGLAAFFMEVILKYRESRAQERQVLHNPPAAAQRPQPVQQELQKAAA